MLPKYLLSALLVVCLSGCFEIVEEVTYKDKQSGTFMLTANCSQSKTRLKTLMKLDTFMGARIPQEEEIFRYIGYAEYAMRQTQGVTNVNSSIDFENFIFSISFSFDKTETLNKALNNAAIACGNKNDIPYMDVFSFSNNTFARNKTPNDTITDVSKIKKAPLKLISGATITSIYRFASEVKKSTNSKALISKNRKAVMLKQQVSDVITNPEIFINTITF